MSEPTFNGYTFQGQNDCVLVSISNYTGKSYAEVMKAAWIAGHPIEKINARGIPTDDVQIIIAHLLGRICRVSRPKNYKNLSGIACWHVPNVRKGHATALLNGIVYDTDGWCGTTEEYRVRTGFVLRRLVNL